MKNIPYRHHRFHPDIIKRAVWLYFRFTMSYQDVEDLLAGGETSELHKGRRGNC